MMIDHRSDPGSLADRLRIADEDGSYPLARDRFVERAADDGLVDVAYRTLDSPVGTLLLAATDEGLVMVAFDAGVGELDRLAREVSPRVLRQPARLDPTVRQLEEYFAGRRTSFDLPLDLRLARGFRRIVLDHLRAVPFGTTTSYAELAGASGRPRAVRAAASACATNPIPIVVPCHRVVRTGGGLGGYAGGVATKRLLLDLERAAAS